ncbi:hypothetical protein D3C78_1339850 [compost metagenome]
MAFMTCLLRWARSTIAGTSGWPLSSTITETVEHLQLRELASSAHQSRCSSLVCSVAWRWACLSLVVGLSAEMCISSVLRP